MKTGVNLVAALTWEPQVKGALYVIISTLVLCGSCYMLLATNVGARLGFLLAGAGLFGWLATLGIVWWVYGQGPKGPDPTWRSQGIVFGEPGRASREVLRGFPNDWEKLELTDPAVADAAPAADSVLAPAEGEGPFEAAADYILIGAFKKGGETYGPLGLDFRPLDVFHRPHYLLIQVQKSMQQPNPAGGPPRAVADPSAPPVSALLLRDLGAKRLHPAVFTIASTIAFGLFCFQLHVRDKEAAARRQAETESGSLEPVRT